MSLEWETYTIGESCDLLTGFPFKSKYYLDDGDFKVVRGDNVKTGFIKWDDKKRCWNDIDEKLKKYLLKNEDIVLAMDGNVGQNRAIISNNDLPALLAQRVACIRSKKDFDQNFIRYLIFSDNFRKYIDSIKTGTTINHISLKQISEYEFKAPDKITQQKIGQILRNIDDKININQEVNKNLDELCHIIFKHYFIDFTPFIDKGLVDSEIGQIPKGWVVTTVGNILDCKLGGTPSRSNESYWGGDIAWINSGKINEFRIIEPSEYITEEGLKKSATKLLPAKTTVIAITGATLGQISLLEIDSCANQSVIGVIPNKEYPYEFVYPLISSILDDLLKHQTGGAQQHINKNNVESFNIVCPPNDIISKYTNIISPLYSQISSNCFEIEKLQKLRDILLPKLMSGEIDVSAVNCDLE